MPGASRLGHGDLTVVQRFACRHGRELGEVDVDQRQSQKRVATEMQKTLTVMGEQALSVSA